MHINTPILRQQILHEDQPLVDHGDEGIRALAPSVAVGDFFEDVGLLGEGVAADLDIHGEIRAHVEGRVDVNQLQPALRLDLLAQRPVFQGGEDELVIALKNASAELKKIIYSTMSKRAVEALEEQLGFLGPKRLSEVEAAQDRVIQIVRELEEDEEIILDTGGSDVVVQ